MLVCVAAGGNGTRMAPVTSYLNKHLIPIGHGKLMIDMPLSFLQCHGIADIEIVTGSKHASQICDYVGDGDRYGFERVSYSFQSKAAGIADIFNRLFHKRVDDGVLLILGDNYFSHRQQAIMELLKKPESKAIAWEFDIGSLEAAKQFGQIMRNDRGVALSIIEKPKAPTHSKILTGLYYFPADVFMKVKNLAPSQRNELEITDLLKAYFNEDRLKVEQVKGKWADLGEQESWLTFLNHYEE